MFGLCVRIFIRNGCALVQGTKLKGLKFHSDLGLNV